MSRKDRVGIAAQADLYTPATAVDYSPPLTSEEGAINRATLDIEEMVGSRAQTRTEYGLRSFAVPLNGAPRPKSLGLILAAHYGEPVSTQPDVTGAPLVHKHVFNPLLEDYPVPITVWGVNKDPLRDLAGAFQPQIVIQYQGCVGNTLQLSAEVNNYLLMESGMLALDADPDAVEPAMTQDATSKWSFSQITATIALPPAAAVDIPLASFSFNSDNNLEDDQGRLGSLGLDDIPIGNLDTTLEFVALRDIPGHFKRAFRDTPEQVAIKITAAGRILATVAGTPPTVFRESLVIDFPYLETITAPVTRSGSDTLRNVTVTANVVLDETSGKVFTMELQNTEDGTKYVLAP